MRVRQVAMWYVAVRRVGVWCVAVRRRHGLVCDATLARPSAAGEGGGGGGGGGGDTSGAIEAVGAFRAHRPF